MSNTEIKTAGQEAEEREQAAANAAAESAARLAAVLGSLPPIFASCLCIKNARLTSDSTRLPLDVPFRQGDFVYATNVEIAVRIPLAAAPGAEIAPELEQPDMMLAFGGEWRSEPSAFPEVMVRACATCKGRRVQVRKGGGVRIVGPCHECNGTGMAGSGVQGLFVVPGIKLSYRYLALLAKHKAKLFVPAKGRKNRPLRFAIGEHVEGVVMGLKMEKRR
jgi:hypothetical protein